MEEPLRVILLVTEALERIGVPYAIGGSFASGVHGVYRASNDADIVADMKQEHAEALVAELGDAFYAPRTAIDEAVRDSTSFNVIHRETMFKVDVFLAQGKRLEQVQLERRQRLAVSRDPQRHVYVASAEDVVLAKLTWYEQSGRVSENQWRDVLGVLKVQAGRLDTVHLRVLAEELGIGDLLQRAWEEGS